MSFMKLCCVFAVGIIFGQTDGQCIGRIRTVVPAYPQPTVVSAYPQPSVLPAYPQPSVIPAYAQPPCCSSSKNEELGAALLLAQLLSEKDEKSTYSNQNSNSNCPVYASGNLNVEDIIMKLVNALIYTTTQAGGKSTSTSTTTSGSGSGSGNLIDLDLLGKNGNLLGLGLGGQGVLGVGVGQ